MKTPSNALSLSLSYSFRFLFLFISFLLFSFSGERPPLGRRALQPARLPTASSRKARLVDRSRCVGEKKKKKKEAPAGRLALWTGFRASAAYRERRWPDR